MLGRLHMSVDECIEKYLTLSEATFSLKRVKSNVFGRSKDIWKASGKYQSDVLAEQFMKTAGLLEGDEQASFYELAESVKSCSLSLSQCKIWEAARATSAASGFFDPIKIGWQDYVDGATGRNNPVNEVFSEAKSIWPDAPSRIQCFVSIGTGIPEPKDFGENLAEIKKAIIAITTETEDTERRFYENHESFGLGGRYFRINVDKGLRDVSLDEFDKVGKIIIATESYLNGPRVQDIIQEFTQVVPMSSVYAGSGKTILSSTIIEHLEQQGQGTVAFFYFSYHMDKDQAYLSRLFRISLILQILKTLIEPIGPNFLVPRRFRELYHKYQPSQDPSDEDLEGILRYLLDLTPQTFIVVNALDECSPSGDQLEVIETLGTIPLMARTECHIILTSRKEQAIEEAIRDLPLEKTIIPFDIGLEATYERMLKKIDDDDKFEEAYAIFRWIAFSTTRLNLAAMSELAAFEIHDPEVAPESDDFSINFSTRNRFDDPTEMQNLLSSLVIIPDGDSPYRTFPSIAHSTVLEYLMSPRVLPTKFRLDHMDATWFILKSSWAYITHYDAAPQRSKFKPYPLLEYACYQVWECALELVRRNSILKSQISKHLTSTSNAGLSSDGTTAKFAVWWFCYRMELPESFQAMTYLDLVGTPKVQLGIPSWNSWYSVNSIPDGTLLLDAAGAGESTIVKLLLDMRPIRENMSNLDLAFRRASSKPTDVFKPYQSILAGGENTAVLTELLEVGADVNGVGVSGDAAIHLAATHGHLDIVTFLTERQGVYLDNPNGKGQTALLLASMHSHTDVVALLLSLTGSVSHRADEEGRTPLSWAATSGNKALCDLLHRDQNVDVIKADFRGRTPLIWVSMAGQNDSIKSLLKDPRVEPDLLLDDPRALDLAPETTTALVTASVQLPDEYIWDNPMTPLACKKATGQMDASNTIPSEEMSISRISTVDDIGSEIWSLEFSADGRYMAVCQDSGHVLVWDVYTGRPKVSLQGHDGGVPNAAWEPNSSTLLTCCRDGYLRLWDVETYQWRAVIALYLDAR
ncbi:calcium-independent phospholipase A2-gamma [Fusarium phyllophilum]|uniref:phospholipase A2 n=1 Tax=Fusarium phyllophilum TaxID=47803 RepID=A0A8H5K4H1_9HYPO|nr:calcium-independent phospholipase A2-gamma [Fusarium phyllophilum]